MKIILKRMFVNKYGRFSKLELLINGKIVFECDSLERIEIGTTPNQCLALPQGEYECDFHYSSKKGAKDERLKHWLLRISNENVNKNRFILIHIGNYLKDTLGCVLLGKMDAKKTGVYQSVDTCDEFYKKVFEYCKNKGIKVSEDTFVCKMSIKGE